MVNIHVEPMEFCLMNMEAYIYLTNLQYKNLNYGI
jgi:hypothetical protein